MAHRILSFFRWAGVAAGGFGLVALLVGCGSGRYEDRLRDGLAHLREGRYDDARADLERAARLQPDSPSAHGHLGIAYWHLGNTNRAIDSLAFAVDLGDGDLRILEWLAEVQRQAGRLSEARRLLMRIDDRAPDQPRILTRLALVEVAEGRPEAAMVQLKRVLELDPVYPPALYNLAVLQRDHQKDLAAALRLFWKYVETETRDPHHDRAREEMQMLRRPRVVASPAVVPVVPAPSRPTPAAPVAAPVAAIPSVPSVPVERIEPVEDDMEEAEPVVAVAPAPAPAPVSAPAPAPVVAPAVRPVPPVRAPSAVERARRALNNDGADEAVTLLREEVGRNPGNAEALWMLAELYHGELRNPVRARESYALFIARFPADRRTPQARRLLAAAVQAPTPAPSPAPVAAAGRASPAGAVEVWNQAVRAQQRQDWAAAEAGFRRVLELEPKKADAAYQIGMIRYRGHRDLPGARDAFLRALTLDRGMANAAYMGALVSREMKQNQDALIYAQRAIALRPDYARAHYLLGILHRERGSRQQAIEHQRLAIRYASDADTQQGARMQLRGLEASPGAR